MTLLLHLLLVPNSHIIHLGLSPPSLPPATTTTSRSAVRCCAVRFYAKSISYHIFSPHTLHNRTNGNHSGRKFAYGKDGFMAFFFLESSCRSMGVQVFSV